MKKLISLMLCLALMLCVTACSKDSASTPTPPASSEEPTSTPIPEPQAVKPQHTHDWAPATFWTPRTCKSCGETSGQPLTPGFVKLGYKLSSLGTTYEYQSVCEEPFPTVGEVTVSYETISGNDKYPAKDGYEWRVAHIIFRFFDDNAWDYGPRAVYFDADYYTMVSDSVIYVSEPPDTRRIGWKDGDHDVEFRSELLRNEWAGKEAFVEREDAFLVPVGYDGITIACINLTNSDIYDGSGEKIQSALLSELVSDDTLWFRLN